VRKRPGKTAGAPRESRYESRGRCTERRAISATEGPSTERVVGASPSRIDVPPKEALTCSVVEERMQSAWDQLLTFEKMSGLE
jgi:hypothetical protein